MANKLLDEAGYKRGADGIRFEITHDITPYGEEWRRFGEYVQQCSASSGIKVNLRYEDVPDVAEARVHRLRLPAHEQLDPDARRSGDRRASSLPLEADQAGNGVRNGTRW